MFVRGKNTQNRKQKRWCTGTIDTIITQFDDDTLKMLPSEAQTKIQRSNRATKFLETLNPDKNYVLRGEKNTFEESDLPGSFPLANLRRLFSICNGKNVLSQLPDQGFTRC